MFYYLLVNVHFQGQRVKDSLPEHQLGQSPLEIEVLNWGRCAVCNTNRALELTCRRCGGKNMSILRVENKLLIWHHMLDEKDFHSLRCMNIKSRAFALAFLLDGNILLKHRNKGRIVQVQAMKVYEGGEV